MVRWFRRRSHRSRWFGAVLGLLVAVGSAAGLDALKSAVLPSEHGLWAGIVALLVGAGLGVLVDRGTAAWIETHLGAGRAVVDTRVDVDRHFDPRARGVMLASQVEHLFMGRHTVLLDLNRWLRSRTSPRLLFVTGDPGSGKSAVLGRVVTTADPGRRRRLPRRDRGVRAPLWSVACEVHAQGKSVTDIATEIGAALGATAVVDPAELHVVLAKALKRRRRRFVLVLDALDEADAPRAVVKEILNPLLRASPSLGVRVLVGTRRTDEIGSLPAALEGRRVTIDLDEDRYFLPDDVQAYAKAWLQIRPDGPYTRGQQADLLAAEIARRAGHSFLVAGLVAAHHGRDDQYPVRPQDLTGGTSLAEALDDFLARVPDVDGVSARLLLIPLAYAQAPGLAVDLWAELVLALTGVRVTIGSLEAFARSGATNLLVTTAGTSANPVYRLFHQALNDTLVTERDRQALGDQDRATIADALRQMIPVEGWHAAPAYLARSLGGHLVAAGQLAEIEDLLTDSDYLLHADLMRLSTSIAGLDSPTLHEYRQLIGITPHAIDAGPEDRACAFAVSALQLASPQVTYEVAGMLAHADSAIRPRWGHLQAADRLLQILTGHTSRVDAVGVTPDGTRAVTSSYDGTARVWDLVTGAELAVLAGHTGPVNAVVVTPDGTQAVTGGGDRTVRVWDLTTGAEQAVLTGHTRGVWAVAVTPDGTQAVTGGGDRTVRVWDLTTGAERAVLTGHTSGVGTVAVTPDGTRVVTAGDRDGAVRVWDLATGAERAVLTGHTSGVGAVAVTPDGLHAVTGGGDRTVRVWDLTTGAERAVLTGHTSGVDAVAVTPDGTRVVTAGDHDGAVRVWDLATGIERAVLTGHTSGVDAVAVTPDGLHVVTGSYDSTVRVWNLATGTQRAVLTGHTLGVRAVVVTPDGTRAVTGSFDSTARVWDLATGGQQAPRTSHIRGVTAVEVTRDGTCVITGGDRDGAVRVWDRATGNERAVLRGHTGMVDAVAVTPDGTHAVTGSFDGSVRVWDLTTGTERAFLTCHVGHVGMVHAVAVTPDGTHAVIGGRIDGRAVLVWDLATGTERAVLTGHTGGADAVAVTPDGTRTLIDGRHGTERLWHLITGIRPSVPTDVGAVAVTPDGTHALMCSRIDNRVWVGDMITAARRVILTGHTGGVLAVAVAPDGLHAVTGSDDTTVRVWDLATGIERAVLTGHSGRANAVAVTPDGLHVVTGSDDQTVRVWDLATGAEQAVLHLPGLVPSLAVSGSTLVVALTTGILTLDVVWDRLASRK